MNERLIEVIRLIRAKYIEKLPLRNVHRVDKLDLFLYIFLRNAIINKREGLGITFTMTVNNMGVLQLQANDINDDITFAVWDTISKGYDNNTFDFLSEYDIQSINTIVTKYGMYAYTELLEHMTNSRGNYISPELTNVAPIPFIITEEFIKKHLKVE